MDVVAQAFDPNTWEAEVVRSVSSRPIWSTKWVQDNEGSVTQRNPVSKNKIKQKQTNKKKQQQ